MTLIQSQFSSRNQLGTWMEEIYPGTVGVEVGTHRGEFANILLHGWKSGILYCVDPWTVPEGYESQAKDLGGTPRIDDYRQAKKAVNTHGKRAILLRCESEVAVGQFLNETFSFVYIDGDHRYEKVRGDLFSWWSKIMSGGVLAGHDFVMPGEKCSWAGDVQRAVVEFASERNLDIEMIVEEGGLPWSFIIRKPTQ